MSATVTDRIIEVLVERSEASDELGGASPRRSSTETEADKVRRQQQVRRKTTLARRALAASRSR